MGFIWICLFTFVAGAAFGDDSCPPAKEISPCTCDGEGFNCMNAKSLDDIRNAFSAKFKYGGVRSVWVQGTPITHLPANLFGNVKSQQFYIEVNEITKVDLDAFSASKSTLAVLSFFGNKISEFPFEGLSKFESLGTLNLGRNQIETIPANAFSSRSMFALILAQNRITQVGMNAFSGLPGLGRLELSYNKIGTLGPMSLALQRHSDGLQINLAANEISEVSQSAFTGTSPFAVFLSSNKLTSLKKDPFSTLITQIAQKGGIMEVSGNPFNCKGCDYSWLEVNKDLLEGKLLGFSCPDGKQLGDLTKSNIECHGNLYI